MTQAERIRLALSAARELGIDPLLNYARYQFGIRTGLIEKRSRKVLAKLTEDDQELVFQPLFELPSRQLLRSILGEKVNELFEEAEEICQGKIRIFGWQVVDLDYSHGKSDLWFTQLEMSPPRENGFEVDLKFFWEPARFGWLYTLARAYLLKADQRYAEVFWQKVESFLEHHPPYRGVHWLSGQEVALRLISWVFGFHVFQAAAASTPERQRKFFQALAIHAGRIPCTLHYARAQNNNHLLSEAVGLMTAGTVLKQHPCADQWWLEGWKWFLQGIRKQIQEDGTYVQHSVNYHRLMLQLALWGRLIALKRGLEFPRDVSDRLRHAAHWLAECCDPITGKAPNLGPNDGASIQPLSQTPFEDYRAVAQAALRAFVGQAAYPMGPYDEMSVWYGVWDHCSAQEDYTENLSSDFSSQQICLRKNSWVLLRSKEHRTWAALRCPRFQARPGHADLLHFDLWWEGINLACDAGTYRYTATPPWDNSLRDAFVHNTITVDGRNPMTDAGKFLWLDWAKSTCIVEQGGNGMSVPAIEAEHDGYHSLGVRVQRVVTLIEDHIWDVRDKILPQDRNRGLTTHSIRLHWLLPFYDWQVYSDQNGYTLKLDVHSRHIALKLIATENAKLRVIAAGKVVYGEYEDTPNLGYCSPTYNLLLRALSIVLEVNGVLPVTLESIWELPEAEAE